jgi:hypothetical protein
LRRSLYTFLSWILQILAAYMRLLYSAASVPSVVVFREKCPTESVMVTRRYYKDQDTLTQW